MRKIKREAGKYVKKHKKRRGISIGFPLSKNAPMKMADVKASVELEKLQLYNKDLYTDLKNQDNPFELLFEKNIPEPSQHFTSRSSFSSIQMSKRGSKTQRGKVNSLLFVKLCEDTISRSHPSLFSFPSPT